MKEGCKFLCIGLGVGAVCNVGWSFGHRDVPQLVVCAVSFDEWFLVAGDGDIVGF